MDLIGVGFGRTGTLSMKAALERLGWGPCFHMRDVFENPDRAPYFQAAARGEDVDWDVAFAGYRSTVDWPGAAFWRQLVSRYPEAKVLLTVRDPQRWYASVRDTILRPTATGEGGPAPADEPPAVRAGRTMVNEVIWQHQFDGRGHDEEYAIRVFNEHNAAVRSEVPADQLLVFEAAEGWGPLCEFLGAELPDEPFPHLNDGASWRARRAERLANS